MPPPESAAISFVDGERVRFSLDGLHYAIAACGSDLYEAPIADLKAFLTPGAVKDFPSLQGR